jgi:hypothetical protein
MPKPIRTASARSMLGWAFGEKVLLHRLLLAALAAL